MGLTVSQRQAVTRTIARRYKRSDRVGEGVILDELCDTAAELLAMSAATMDRRLGGDRAKMALRGRSHTKPGHSNSHGQLIMRLSAQRSGHPRGHAVASEAERHRPD